MTMPAAPVARQAPQASPAKKGAQAAAVPFPIASLRRVRQSFDTGNLVLGQSTPAIEIPATGGYARWLELEVSSITAGNAAAVAFQPDAPMNVLSFMEFLPPSGDPPIVPHTSYQIFLWNKYGAFSTKPPWSDPMSTPASSNNAGTGWYATAGAGATGGSFYVKFRLPFEIDPSTGFCAITNSAANKSYLLNLTVNTSANIYSVAPTNAPAIRVIGWVYYWDEPAAQTRQGTSQAPGPLGLGSFSQLRLDQPPITAGDKYIKVNNAGPVLRMLGVVLRTAAGARVANTAITDIPQMWDFVFNTRDRWLISDNMLLNDMGLAWGYGQAYAGTKLAPTLPTVDGPKGLDNGVRFFPYFMDFGDINPMYPRSQYQITGDATLTQIRGISFGANVATMEILSNLIRPASSMALYPPNRIG
jgi:hypothetical protein